MGGRPVSENQVRLGRIEHLLSLFQCGAGVNAAPMSYELDGEQFVAVAAGGNFQLRFAHGDSVFVFGLPRKAAAAK